MIVPKDGKFEVKSEDGSKSLGTYDTRGEAEHRLAQVERFSSPVENLDAQVIARASEATSRSEVD